MKRYTSNTPPVEQKLYLSPGSLRTKCLRSPPPPPPSPHPPTAQDLPWELGSSIVREFAPDKYTNSSSPQSSKVTDWSIFRQWSLKERQRRRISTISILFVLNHRFDLFPVVSFDCDSFVCVCFRYKENWNSGEKVIRRKTAGERKN